MSAYRVAVTVLLVMLVVGVACRSGTPAPVNAEDPRLRTPVCANLGPHLDQQGVPYYGVEDPDIAKPTLIRPGQAAPKHPDSGSGEVLLRFYVDTLGRPETIEVLKATRPGLQDPAVNTVRGYLFTPALTRAGCRVRQEVLLPFQFQ